MKIAYADPIYIGQARKLYKEPEMDHVALIERLETEFPDGWALSASVPSMHLIMDMLRDRGLDLYRGDYRIGSCVKPFCAFKPNVNPAYAWEPVFFRGGGTENPPAANPEGLGPVQHHAQARAHGREARRLLLLGLRVAEPPARRRVPRPLPRQRRRHARLGEVARAEARRCAR